LLSPRARRVLGLIGFCLLVVVGRVSFDSSRAYQEGLRFEASDEPHEAAVRFGRAIHMYLPLLPVPSRASDRLIVLAEAAHARGSKHEARFCWEQLRSGWLSVRSTWQPGRRYIARAEDELAAIMLGDPDAAWPDPKLSSAEREASVRAVLEAREDPVILWVLVMGLGWFVWLGAAAAAILKGIPRDDDAPIAWPVIGRWCLISVGGYAVWLLGLALA
jgi:hypothetical protein